MRPIAKGPTIATLSVALLAAEGWFVGPAFGQFQKNEYEWQKQAAQQAEPAPIFIERGVKVPAPEVMRVRFYADADFRGGSGARWQDRMRAQIGLFNQVVTPAFGVRMEAESFRRWERSGPSGALKNLLHDLERLDAGAGVDWVVGLVGPTPLVSMSFHDLGQARVLGRHFVVRSMASAAELDDLRRVFSALDETQREALHSHRKAHKEIAIFLHEWAHTLGLFHVSPPSRIMAPGYSHRAGLISEMDAALLAAGLEARLAARGRDVVDWSPLRAFVRGNDAPGWMAHEKAELLAGLEGSAVRPAVPTGGPTGESAPPPRGPGVAGGPEGIAGGPAGAAGGPAGASGASGASGSGTGGAASGGATGAAATALVGENLVSAVTTHARAGRFAEGAALVHQAVAAAEQRRDVGAATWVAIARSHAELGAFTAAEAALARSSAGADEKALAELVRMRRLLGLPKRDLQKPGGFVLPPEAEPDYVAAVRRVHALLASRKLPDAGRALDAELRRFPGGPGLLAARCEVALQSGRMREAAQSCAKAVSGMEDLPRAHYLGGIANANLGKMDAAMKSLRRAIELVPDEDANWRALEEISAAAGRSEEYSELLMKHRGKKGQAPKAARPQDAPPPPSDLPRLSRPGELPRPGSLPRGY